MKKISNKNKISILLVLTFLSALLFITGITTISLKTEVSALELSGEINSQETINENYNLLDSFTIPDGKIIYNEQEYTPDEKYVIKPNGVILSSDVIQLDSIGNYTLVYSKKEDNAILTAKKTFKVSNGAYSVTSNKSSVSYGALAHGLENEEGIKINLVSGDTFTYNQVIDLSKSDLTQPVLRYYTNHFTTRISDVGENYMEYRTLYVTLTDCYDQNNSITLCTEWCSNDRPYFRAYASGQIPAGLTYEETKAANSLCKEYFADGNRYLCYFDVWGTYYHRIFRQVSSEGLGVSVYFDVQTNRLYLSGKYMDIITDFDDPDIYGATLFKGFTTGEVYLSITAGAYEKDSGIIEIGAIKGMSGSKLNQTTVVDTTPPLINIDTQGVNDLSNITVAKDEPVKIFSAKAYDINSCSDVKAKIFYNYGLPAQAQVGSDNGYFTPTKEGDYVIEYSSTDGFGNTATKTITLSCVNAPNNKVVEFDVEKLNNLSVGQTVSLPEHTATSVNGAVYVNIFAIKDGERTVIDVENKKITPLTAGEYQILYVYGDGIYEYEFSYNVSAINNGYVSFTDYHMPLSFIKGAKYTLDKVVATEYGDVVSEIPVTAYISEDGEEYKQIDITDFTVNANSSVKFKFSAKGYSIETKGEIPVTDVGFGENLDMSKYFIGDFVKSASSVGAKYVSNSKTGLNELEFINVLSLSQFSFGFTIPEELSNFGALRVKIIDFYNRENVSEILYANRNGKVVVSYNGGTEQLKNNSFAGQSISLFYDNGDFRDSISTVLVNTVNYTSDKILLKVSLENIDGESGIEVFKVCNQSFSDGKYDRISPMLIIDYSNAGYEQLNSKIKIDVPEAIDVLTPFYQKNLLITVISPSESNVVSSTGKVLNGAVLDEAQEITLTEYGSYYIMFSYTDQNDRFIDGLYIIFVEDRLAPTIEIEDGYNQDTVITASVGDKVSVMGCSADDNSTKPEDILIHKVVYGPDYSLIAVENGEFIAQKVGKYKVCYYAKDAAGNYAMTYYTVIVK